MPVLAHSAPILRRLLPVFDWLPAYRRAWLLPDVLAGLAVWAVMVPEGMAYPGIVGVPPIMGLYTIVPPLIAYAVLGMRGFIEGLVYVTIIGQIPNLLGIEGVSGPSVTAALSQ